MKIQYAYSDNPGAHTGLTSLENITDANTSTVIGHIAMTDKKWQLFITLRATDQKPQTIKK